MKTPRPYQTEAHNATLRQLETYDSTVVVLPTGLGKTVYASKLIAGWERGNCLFLAHTRELINQAADKLAVELGYRPAVEMNVQGAELDTLYQGGMVVVGSVQTMYGDKRLEKYRRHPFGLIVVDECHHATSATYTKVIDHFRKLNPSLKVVGITATPNRADGTALGLLFESVAYQMSINDAITGGWLVPVRQEYVVVDSLDLDAMRLGKNEFGDRDFKAADLEEVLIEEEALHKQAIPIIDKVGERRTLIFTSTVRHAHDLAAVLNRYKDGTAAAVDGTTLPERRKELIRDFTEGNLQFLCNCAVLTEGFDAPVCSAVVMARPTKSLSLYTQMLGRGLRPLPGVVDGVNDAHDRRMAILESQKPACMVLDFVGNSEHKLASSYDVLGGNYDVEVRKLAQQEASRQARDVNEVMEQAAALLVLEQQQRQRKQYVAGGANYASFNADPFSDGPPIVGAADMGGAKRGGASDAQVGLLVNLGVDRAQALAMTKRQAGAVIDNMSANRCTSKQAKVLQKHGIDPAGIGMDRASRIIDAIAQNGWRRPEELPE